MMMIWKDLWWSCKAVWHLTASHFGSTGSNPVAGALSWSSGYASDTDDDDDDDDDDDGGGGGDDDDDDDDDDDGFVCI